MDIQRECWQTCALANGGNMTFYQAVAKCLRKYATFKGRASRSEYWWFAAFLFLFQWPLALTTYDADRFIRFLSIIYFVLVLVFIIPNMAVFTRRLHDTGKSGWSWLLLLIPVVGWIIVFVWLTREGDLGPNSYGDPDNGAVTPQGIRTRINMQEEIQQQQIAEDSLEIEEESSTEQSAQQQSKVNMNQIADAAESFADFFGD